MISMVFNNTFRHEFLHALFYLKKKASVGCATTLELDGERVIWQPASSGVAPLHSEPLKFLSDNYIWALALGERNWEPPVFSKYHSQFPAPF